MHWTLRIRLCPTVFKRFHGVISLQGSGSCSDLLNTQVWRPPALATGRPSVPPLSNFQWDPPAPAWNKTKIAHCNNDKWPIEVQSMIPLCSPVMPSFSDLPACLCDLVISCDILCAFCFNTAFRTFRWVSACMSELRRAWWRKQDPNGSLSPKQCKHPHHRPWNPIVQHSHSILLRSTVIWTPRNMHTPLNSLGAPWENYEHPSRGLKRNWNHVSWNCVWQPLHSL